MPENALAQKGVQGDETPHGLAERNVVYTALDYQKLNDLDRFARFILAVAHSAIYAGTDREQFFAAQRCVATAISEGRLYFAANNLLTRRDQEARGKSGTQPIPEEEARRIIERTDLEIWASVMRDLVAEARQSPEKTLVEMRDVNRVQGFEGICFIANPRGADDTTLHAEMQLVSHFETQSLRLENDQIGVSKPCCPSCSKRLTGLGIDHSYYHDIADPRWFDPGVEAPWWS